MEDMVFRENENLILLRRRFLREAALVRRLLREYRNWEAQSHGSSKPLPPRFAMKTDLMKDRRGSWRPGGSESQVHLEDDWVDDYY